MGRLVHSLAVEDLDTQFAMLEAAQKELLRCVGLLVWCARVWWMGGT